MAGGFPRCLETSAMMRVICFYYDRFTEATTSKMLSDENIPHIVLCHTEEQREGFIDARTVEESNIIVTGEPRGLTNNRNFALDLMEEDEWCLFLVDDLKKITEPDCYEQELGISPLPIETHNVTEWTKRFNAPVPMATFLNRAKETARYAEKLGAHLAGFAAYRNPLFRSKKWTMNTLSDGRATLVKKSHLRYDTNSQLMEDYAWTARNIREFGVTVNNQWVLPECGRYLSGGYGTKEERMAEKIEEAAYLTSEYPDLIAYKNKKDWPVGSHITIRRRGSR
jgi:hypothetical protein